MSVKSWTKLYWLWALILACLIVFGIFFINKVAFAHNRTPLPRQIKHTQAFEATITGYSQESGQYTADGTHVAFGVAACPYNLKFGTQFRVRSLYGDAVFTCHDRSAYQYGLFDLWVPSIQEAYSIGRSQRIVELI